MGGKGRVVNITRIRHRLPLTVLVVCCVALLGACDSFTDFGDFYIMDATYETMGKAREDGAIDRGWVPEYLPDTATNIRERHSQDTNEGWGTYSFGDLDLSHFEKHWSHAQSAPLPGDPNRFHGEPTIDWWPGTLNDGLVFYRGIEDGHFWLAVDNEKKTCYFWIDQEPK